MDQRLESTSPSDWKYLAEGGSTVVFTFNGEEHATFSGSVLRIRKSFQDKLASAGDEDDRAIAFQQRAISKLLQATWLPRLESIKIDANWLEDLDKLSRGDRPLERQSSVGGSIDLNVSKVVLSDNLIGGRGWAVEIKPKWGFLPNPEHLSPETREAKLNHCRFCLHKYHKILQHESIAQNYCPLDLFSGDAKRITQALRNLWDSWVVSKGKLNNLRLFSGGTLVDPRDEKSLEHLRTSINSSSAPASLQGSELRELFIETSLPLLSESPVLSTLARLQRTLDPLDIEGLYALSQSPQSDQSAMCGEPSLEEWETIINQYLDPVFQAKLDHKKPHIENLRYYALAHLLSASFKDCSILIRFPSAGKPPVVSVIDLDVKSIERLKKWKNLDHDIAMSFAHNVPKVSACIDAHSS